MRRHKMTFLMIMLDYCKQFSCYGWYNKHIKKQVIIGVLLEKLFWIL